MQKQLIYIAVLAGFTTAVSAQKDDKDLGTEVVNVVKPYTPTLSDAFKVKEVPVIDDEETRAKETITYSIFSFPVASTFAPAKGKSAGVEAEEAEKTFKNYAALGFGNYAAVNGELYITESVGETAFVAGNLSHISQNANIKDTELDSKFMDTRFGILYGNTTEAVDYKVDLGFRNQRYNWYGLPDFFGTSLTETQRQALISSIDPLQTYNEFELGGNLKTSSGIFNRGDVRFTRFWDAFGSAENRFVAKPELSFNVAGVQLNTAFKVDYLSATFENAFPAEFPVTVAPASNENANVILNASPSIKFAKDDFNVDLGVGITYFAESKNTVSGVDLETESRFFLFPKIRASYRIVGDLMIAYAGAEGELRQNSYRDLVNLNPFLSPTLRLRPTENPLNFYGGLKGKLSSTVSFNLRAGYSVENNRAFFQANSYDVLPDNEPYLYGNSFSVVYDKLKTLSFYGELNADLSEAIRFGVNGTFASYNTDVLEEALNLPQIQLAGTVDFKFSSKWSAGSKVFFVGERTDFQFDPEFISIGLEKKTLQSFFDVNAHIMYEHNKQLGAFLRFNNIANQSYQRWLNHPVAGFQVLLGATYKFDF